MEMDAWKIVRVSEDFRVIALGLPVPKYKGNPLDPPLRSRFQARDIYYLPFKVRAQQISTHPCCCSVQRTKTTVSDCVYMQEHNRVMNISNEDWFHENRFIRRAQHRLMA